MSVYALKPYFQALLRPTVKRLVAHGFTANQITLAACALSVVTGGLLYLGLSQQTLWVLLLLPLCLLLRMAMNALDGMLAREFNQQSVLGAYLNELTDVISDTVLYLPLMCLPWVSVWLVGLLVVLASLTEFAGILGQIYANSRRYDGPMGKSDRALWLGALAVLWWWLPTSLAYANWLLVAINGLLVWTIYRRIHNGLPTQGVSQ